MQNFQAVEPGSRFDRQPSRIAAEPNGGGGRPTHRPSGGRSGRRFGTRKREPIFTRADDVNYKEIARLRRCLDERGRILPRRRLGHTAQVQRLVTVAIKRARHVALLPFDQRGDRRER